jgi:hypothetical protein
MTENNNLISDNSSSMSESERLAASIQEMIFAAVSASEHVEDIPAPVEDSLPLTENSPCPVIEEATAPEEEPSENTVIEEEAIEKAEPEAEEEPEPEPIEESEPEVNDTSEAEDELFIDDFSFVPKEIEIKESDTEASSEPAEDTEPDEEEPVECPEVSPDLASEFNGISVDISRIFVVAPSGKEDTDAVERRYAKEFPAAEICSVKGTVNAVDLTDDCGVLLAVKPKVTTYGSYRKVLKSLKKSQAKILGAVIV